jgi:hypothetical protein
VIATGDAQPLPAALGEEVVQRGVRGGRARREEKGVDVERAPAARNLDGSEHPLAPLARRRCRARVDGPAPVLRVLKGRAHADGRADVELVRGGVDGEGGLCTRVGVHRRSAERVSRAAAQHSALGCAERCHRHPGVLK